MTWIDADYTRTFEVEVPLDEVADLLSDPAELRHCMVDLERAEEIDDQTWRWILEEVGAKNITFQGDYTVRYRREGEVVTWESVGEGTMRTEGRAELEAIDEERTRVDYRETLSSDLPIPKLARKVFKPIVSREISRGIDDLLDEVVDYLESGRHRSGPSDE